MQFVNAGQTPPLLRRQNGTVERLMTGGIALGMFEGSHVRVGRLTLEPGDAMVMYSDGITEAEDPDRAAVRRGRAGTDVGALSGDVPGSDGGQRWPRDFRCGGTAPTRLASRRRPDRAGVEQAQEFGSPSGPGWRLMQLSGVRRRRNAAGLVVLHVMTRAVVLALPPVRGVARRPPACRLPKNPNDLSIRRSSRLSR